MTDYDPLTAYLLFGQTKPAVPLDDRQSLHRRIAQHTLALSNSKAWAAILPALKEAGVPHQEAMQQRERVWEERKLLRRRARREGGTT